MSGMRLVHRPDMICRHNLECTGLGPDSAFLKYWLFDMVIQFYMFE